MSVFIGVTVIGSLLGCFVIGCLVGYTICDTQTDEYEKDRYLYKKGYTDGCKDTLNQFKLK